MIYKWRMKNQDSKRTYFLKDGSKVVYEYYNTSHKKLWIIEKIIQDAEAVIRKKYASTDCPTQN